MYRPCEGGTSKICLQGPDILLGFSSSVRLVLTRRSLGGNALPPALLYPSWHRGSVIRPENGPEKKRGNLINAALILQEDLPMQFKWF